MKIKLSEIPVIYINLDKDKEKKKSMEKLLKSNKFKEYKRLAASEPDIPKFVSERKNIGNIYGCSLSHLQARLYYKTPFIVLEDDVEILNFMEEIEIPDDADALYLGNMSYGLVNSVGKNYSVFAEEVSGYNDIYRVFNLLGAHAILHISERYTDACYKSLTEALKNNDVYSNEIKHEDIANDVYFAKLQPEYNIYSLGTPVFYQTGHYEEETNKHITEYMEKP